MSVESQIPKNSLKAKNALVRSFIDKRIVRVTPVTIKNQNAKNFTVQEMPMAAVFKVYRRRTVYATEKRQKRVDCS